MSNSNDKLGLKILSFLYVSTFLIWLEIMEVELKLTNSSYRDQQLPVSLGTNF